MTTMHMTSKHQTRPIPETDPFRPVPSVARSVPDCDGPPRPARVGCPCRGTAWGRFTRPR